MSNSIKDRLRMVEADLSDILSLAVNKNYSQVNITAIALCRDAIRTTIRQIGVGTNQHDKVN